MTDIQQPSSGSEALTASAAAPPPTQHTSNGLGVTALILGILAFVGAFIPFINYASGFLALVGVVFGIVALTRKGRPKGTALAGLITSAVAMILSIVLATVYTAGFVAAVDNSLPKTGAQVADEAEAEAEEPGAPEIGTRDSPAPLSTVIETTSGGAVEYEIAFGTPTLNANDLIAAENQFNSPPEAGHQFALLPVTFTYRGTETGTPWIDVTIEFVSAAGTTHTEGDAMVVAPSPTVMDVNELYPDASGTANVVIQVPSVDVEKGTWTVSGFWGNDKYFVAAQ